MRCRLSDSNQLLGLPLLLNAASSADKNVGGQAVIEGVMIRSPEKVSTSVRLPGGRIVTRTEPFISLTKRKKLLGKVIIRGVVSFFEMLVLGIKTLNYSAEMAATAEDEPIPERANTQSGNFNLAIIITVTISLGLAMAIFFFLPILGILNKNMDFLINFLSYLLAIIPLLRNFTAKEDHLLFMSECSRSHFIAHAIVGYHLAGKFGSVFNIILSARCHFIKNQFLGSMPGQHCSQHILELGACQQVPVFGR